MARETGARVQATITATDPLEILVDGAQTACPAARNSEVGTLTVGARVEAEDRAPRRPMVTGTIEVED